MNILWWKKEKPAPPQPEPVVTNYWPEVMGYELEEDQPGYIIFRRSDWAPGLWAGSEATKIDIHYHNRTETAVIIAIDLHNRILFISRLR